MIYCFDCDNDLLSILEDYEQSQKKDNIAIKKVNIFMEKVKEIFIGFHSASSKQDTQDKK